MDLGIERIRKLRVSKVIYKYVLCWENRPGIKCLQQGESYRTFFELPCNHFLDFSLIHVPCGVMIAPTRVFEISDSNRKKGVPIFIEYWRICTRYEGN